MTAPDTDQISVVYTCCKAQEYWSLNANGELEIEHSDVGQAGKDDPFTSQDRMAALQRDRCPRRRNRQFSRTTKKDESEGGHS